MKNFTSLLALVIVMAGFSSASFAQTGTSTSPATTANATIVAPISIGVGTTLAFGAVAKSATAGSATITPAGVRSATGGVSFSPTSTGSPAASSFTVTGESGYAYAVSFPSATVTLTKATTLETMTVGTFTSNTTGILTAGTQTLLVGATLNVGAGQVAGLYSGTYTVKVDYN